MEVNVCSLYDEKTGDNFFYYLFTDQKWHDYLDLVFNGCRRIWF